MQKEEQLRILDELQTGIDNGVSHDAGGIMKAPVSDFTSTELLAQEQQVFFKESPIFMGLSTDLPGPNSYRVTSETGVSILMTRDGDGQFHAFLNVCRHRGVQVVPEGRGTRNRFSCPFHAWTYANSGKLIAVNREEKFGCIDKDQHGLVELPAQEKHGMLWVRPSPGEGFEIDDLLGGLAPEMASWDFSDNDFSEEQTIHADVNWKLAIDTFGENYHFDVLHKDTLAPEIHGNLQTHDVYDKNYRMAFATRGGFKYVHDNALPRDQWPYRYITLNVYFIYPNVILLIDGAGVDVLRMYPDENNPAKSRTHHSYYIHPDIRERLRQQAEARNNEEKESRFPGFNHVIIDEDYAMAASTQVGALSGAQTHYTFGRNEPALHHYHNSHRLGLGLPLLELVDA